MLKVLWKDYWTTHNFSIKDHKINKVVIIESSLYSGEVTRLKIVTDVVANASNIFSRLVPKNSGLVGMLVTEFLANLDLN